MRGEIAAHSDEGLARDARVERPVEHRGHGAAAGERPVRSGVREQERQRDHHHHVHVLFVLFRQERGWGDRETEEGTPFSADGSLHWSLHLCVCSYERN